MIESIEFKNFKVLKDAKLPLGPFTLIVGANGSGKTTALQSFEKMQNPGTYKAANLASLGVSPSSESPVRVTINWGSPFTGMSLSCQWPEDKTLLKARNSHSRLSSESSGSKLSNELHTKLTQSLSRISIFALEAERLPLTVQLQPEMTLGPKGDNLAGVLDRLKDEEPERWLALNQELQRCLPEYDQILLRMDQPGKKSFRLRTQQGQHTIGAADLSQGTLLALALLTLAYLPDPPPVIGLEEPDRGIHPRLLRQVRDALYRLSYPDSFGESREPVQVIATTQSPYFLDEFSDHPEEIVIAEKVGLEAKFHRLMDHPHMEEILEGTSSLGEVWYTGVLGGVPARS